MKWLEKHTEKVEILGVLLVVLILFTPWVLKQNKIEKRYGFSVSTPELGKKFISPCEQMVVMRVDSGGAFYNAGIRIFDVVLFSPRSVSAFMKKLENTPQGAVLYIHTIPDGFGARNCDEQSEMAQVVREVVAP